VGGPLAPARKCARVRRGPARDGDPARVRPRQLPDQSRRSGRGAVDAGHRRSAPGSIATSTSAGGSSGWCLSSCSLPTRASSACRRCWRRRRSPIPSRTGGTSRHCGGCGSRAGGHHVCVTTPEFGDAPDRGGENSKSRAYEDVGVGSALPASSRSETLAYASAGRGEGESGHDGRTRRRLAPSEATANRLYALPRFFFGCPAACASSEERRFRAARASATIDSASASRLWSG